MTGLKTGKTPWDADLPHIGQSAADRYHPRVARVSDRVFLIGSVAVALHILDDAFISTAPGTSASDHLASAALPFATIVAAIIVWPWLTAAWRAVVALLLGLFTGGVVLLTEGERITSGGITGSDVTALLALAGAATLLALGAILTHRAIERPVRRNLGWAARRLLVVASAYITLSYLFIPVLTAAHATHPKQAPVAVVDLGVAYESVSFATRDGLTLSGWFIPSRNGATILALSGANNDRTNVANHAAMLARHGYGVLLFDPRGMGESEGDPNQFGWQTSVDIRAALDYLAARPDVDTNRIGALGLSMGAEAVLQATAENRAIRAVVAEGAGARSLEEALLAPGNDKWLDLPKTWLSYALTRLASGDRPPPSLDQLTPRIAPRPLLIIYATTSAQAAEAQLSPRYFDAAGEPKEIWPIDDAGHTQGFATHPAEYEARVIRFFDAALTSERSAEARPQ